MLIGWRPLGLAFSAAAMVFCARLVLPGPTVAADQPSGNTAPVLDLPIDCSPGADCWLVNYVDHDPTENIRDYMCGIATYNGADGKGHNGTDFAIRDRAAMRQGVKVLSVASGVVVGIRDGMADRPIGSEKDARSLEGKYCGNGVRIDHGNGWSTQYCHLRKGSVTVRSRQRVKRGAVLGMVGLSGLTRYPHLHITLRHNKRVVDPFVGLDASKTCGPGEDFLWTDVVMKQLGYEPTVNYNLGFSNERADPEKARNGDYAATRFRPNSPALVLWGDFFNVRIGDRITHKITSPAGAIIVEHTSIIEKNQARRFIYVGKPLRSEKWPSGNYLGEIRLFRENSRGKPESLRTTSIRIP